MILFLGTGGYVAGLFHLITHAFFKACLFLGAGSVIAGCHHEQEMTKMGGLWRKMPITAVTFLISVLAISGAPFTSGFFSKDLGLAGAFEYARALPQPWGMAFFWAPAATAYLTAFYMWRCWWLTFGGKPRDHHVYEHARENPVMTLPLTILAVLAIVTGLKLSEGEGVKEIVPVRELIRMSMPGTAESILANTPADHGHGFHAVHTYVKWAFVAGPAIAIAIYFAGFGIADRIRRIWGINLVYIWLKNRMYFDALYEGVLMMLVRLAAALCGLFDKYIVDGLVNFAAFFTRGFTSFTGMFDQVVVDGAVNGVAEIAQDSGRVTSAAETGRLRVYVLCTLTIVALAGAVGTTVWLVK
jgi:NADH-quinone oxidoreductase subunit L